MKYLEAIKVGVKHEARVIFP